MPFKLGYSSLRWLDLDLEPRLHQIRKAGWDGWEIRQSLDWLGTPSRVRRLCQDAGTPVSAVMGQRITLDNDPLMKEQNKRRIDFAAEIEADNFTIIGAERLQDPAAHQAQIAALADLADEFADYAAQYGLDVCYHVHTRTTVDSRSEWELLMSLMNRCKLCIDVSHAQFWGYDPARSIHDFKDRLVYVHLQDWLGYRWADLDEGTLVDTGACLEALDAIGFERWVVACPGDSSRSDEQRIRCNRAYLRGLGY